MVGNIVGYGVCATGRAFEFSVLYSDVGQVAGHDVKISERGVNTTPRG